MGTGSGGMGPYVPLSSLQANQCPPCPLACPPQVSAECMGGCEGCSHLVSEVLALGPAETRGLSLPASHQEDGQQSPSPRYPVMEKGRIQQWHKKQTTPTSRQVAVLKGRSEGSGDPGAKGGEGAQSSRGLAGEAWGQASNLQAGQRGPRAKSAKDGPGGEVAWARGEPQNPVARNIVRGHRKGPRLQRTLRTGLQSSGEERKDGRSWAFSTQVLGRRLQEGRASRGCHATHSPRSSAVSSWVPGGECSLP